MMHAVMNVQWMNVLKDEILTKLPRKLDRALFRQIHKSFGMNVNEICGSLTRTTKPILKIYTKHHTLTSVLAHVAMRTMNMDKR